MEIPRVPRLSREEFEERYLARGRPVIVTGGAAAWGTDGPWTPERLRQALGARAVKVASSERDVFGYDETEAAYQVEEMAFGAAADLITRVQPSPGCVIPSSSATVSSARTLVVPTAITRLPAARATFTARAVSSGTR